MGEYVILKWELQLKLLFWIFNLFNWGQYTTLPLVVFFCTILWYKNTSVGYRYYVTPHSAGLLELRRRSEHAQCRCYHSNWHTWGLSCHTEESKTMTYNIGEYESRHAQQLKDVHFLYNNIYLRQCLILVSASVNNLQAYTGVLD